VNDEARRRRLLVFVVAYNAERTIESVLARIPSELQDDFDVEALVIDDSSNDATFERGDRMRRSHELSFPLHVLYNPENQGYGGNQKIGFHFALTRGFDFVALVHGDGQYAPERLPDLMRPLAAGEADAVFGSRMLTQGGARSGGMPLYKFVGNKILSGFQNLVLRTNLSEFHSGYRVYATAALRAIPFDLNTNDFHFDTEIIIQLLRAGLRIVEVPIPTYYGDEICRVDGVRYAGNVTRATLKSKAQDLGLLYDRRFDVGEAEPLAQYTAKFDYDSPHAYALELIPAGSRVLDLGCAGGYLGSELRGRGCYVAGVDLVPLKAGVELDEFYLHDFDEGLPPVDVASFDYVLLLDVVEHLHRPEAFMRELYDALKLKPDTHLVVSTGNIGFAITRLMLLAGQFNYGKRGILDMTHTRLFTFSTLRRLLDGAGFRIESMRGVPAPFPLALGDGLAGLALVRLNRLGTRAWPGFFAYQMFVVAQPRRSLDRLLQDAFAASEERLTA
jgi:glycosyltransferase involved in cell wall biosynthesis